MPWGVAAAAVGGLIAADGSRSAGNTAADATNNASAKEMEMFNLSRQDQQPWMDRGNQAGNKLQYLLGLPSTDRPTSGNSLAGQRLVDTSGGAPQYNLDLYNNNPAYKAAWDEISGLHYDQYGKDYNQYSDSSAIEREIRLRLGNQLASDNQAAKAATASDPTYGSLLRNFGQSDLDNDVVYQSGLQFGLDEGTKGINRMAAASGNSLSGATLKALQRHAIDYGSTKANESFNRFNTQQGNSYNRLAGIAGTGQTATAQVGNQAVNTGASMGQNALIGGMARGSSAIGQTNALTGAMNNIYGVGKKKGWWDTGSGNAFQPNANGIGGNPYEGFDALANGGWGIE